MMKKNCFEKKEFSTTTTLVYGGPLGTWKVTLFTSNQHLVTNILKKSTSEQHTATNLVDSFICPTGFV